MTGKIEINRENRNLRKACKWYPCHNISDENYDCHLCYCPFYDTCSAMNNIELGGYWLKYKKDGQEGQVWACEHCTIIHTKHYYKIIASMMRQGKSDREILTYLIKEVKQGRWK